MLSHFQHTLLRRILIFFSFAILFAGLYFYLNKGYPSGIIITASFFFCLILTGTARSLPFRCTQKDCSGICKYGVNPDFPGQIYGWGVFSWSIPDEKYLQFPYPYTHGHSCNSCGIFIGIDKYSPGADSLD